MPEIFERTSILIGDENLDKLKNSRVAVFGVGGVGGHCAEALVRSGRYARNKRNGRGK
jgi:tRNA A37 threonylcarbamoyladenosine dehydratase